MRMIFSRHRCLSLIEVEKKTFAKKNHPTTDIKSVMEYLKIPWVWEKFEYETAYPMQQF